MSLQYLIEVEVEQVVEIITSHRLSDPAMRALLFNGLPEAMIADLPLDAAPRRQLLLDLNALNGHARVGTQIPLAVWLENAAGLMADQGSPDHAKLMALGMKVAASQGRSAQVSTGEIKRRRALLIGVSAHPAPLRPLRTPAANVAALGKALADGLLEYDVDSITEPEGNALRRGIETLFAKAKPGEMVLFYFAGRVLISPDGSLYLCATDTDPDLIDSTALPFAWLHRMTNRTRASQAVLIIDAVFQAQWPEEAPSIEISGAVKNELGGGRGKYVMVSSTTLDESLESAEDELSVFTAGLVDGLVDGHGDANEDAVIHIAEWFRHADKWARAIQPDRRPSGWPFDVNPEKMVISRLEFDANSPAPLESVRPAFQSGVWEDLSNQECIPIIGSGIHGSRALSAYAIGKALAERASLAYSDDLNIVAAAEYLERLWNRPAFLRAFDDILTEQAEASTDTATYALLTALSTPLMTISVTFDHVLEDMWAAAKLPHAIITHVQQAADSRYDGVVVVRPLATDPAKKVELTDSQSLLLRDKSERILYKPLGAPYLNRFVAEHGPEGLELDTVVATESDYVDFVGRLQHQKTSVPAAFSRWFRRRSFLFLGYPMDRWHYRLITRIIPFRRALLTRAVRQPTSAVEELAWKRLPADLIPTDPEAFARALLRRLKTEGES